MIVVSPKLRKINTEILKDDDEVLILRKGHHLWNLSMILSFSLKTNTKGQNSFAYPKQS